MAIVPVRDDYTDAATPQIIHAGHTPVVLGDYHTLMITTRTKTSGGGGGVTFASFSTAAVLGAQARMYDTESDDWTRGDPFRLDDINPANARACAATLDGNVLLQGQVLTTTIGTVPAVFADGLIIGGTYGVNPLGYGGSVITQRFQVSEAADLAYAEFFFNSIDDLGGGPVIEAGTVTCSISMMPDGSGTLGESAPTTLGHTAFTRTFSLGRVTVIPGVDYYVTLKTDTPALLGLLRLGTDNVHTGPLDTTFTNAGYIDGVGLGGNLYCTLGYVVEEEHPVENWEAGAGYAVLDLNGEQIVEAGPVTPVPGSLVADIGTCYSAPDAMVRIPATNRFWAWRHHIVTDSGGDSHRLYVDLLQVTGTNVAIIDTVAVTSDPLPAAHVPHQIIPITSTTAMTMLCLPDRLRLVHLVVDTASNVTLSTQDIVGYPPNDGATLVPGLNHQAELLVKATAGDPLKLIRLGITWEGTSFVITSLPITQLIAGITPPDYTPRTKTASVSIVTGAAHVAANGVIITARPYLTNGTDDNWVLLTEYSQTTGEIISNTWKKGDINGGKYDTVQLGDLAVRYDTTTGRIVLGATETYLAAGAAAKDVSRTPRLGIYRHGYQLNAKRRSQREEFER